jgi:hypothetical protein
MKFYKRKDDYNYWAKILKYELNAIFYEPNETNKFSFIQYFKNGKYHNNKSADYIHSNGSKYFSLNNKYYGDQTNFTKESWRRFVKLQAFL